MNGPLARRGLMLGERVEAKYSGSDTDSDTEEYSANAHKINPVTGHVEPPRKSPFEGILIVLTVTIDCYGTLQKSILVFFKLNENQ